MYSCSYVILSSKVIHALDLAQVSILIEKCIKNHASSCEIQSCSTVIRRFSKYVRQALLVCKCTYVYKSISLIKKIIEKIYLLLGSSKLQYAYMQNGFGNICGKYCWYQLISVQVIFKHGFKLRYEDLLLQNSNLQHVYRTVQ